MNGRLGAPLGGEAANAQVDVIVEAEHIAEHAPVEQGAVGVCVRQVGRLKFLRQEVLEDFLSECYLPIAECPEIEDRKSLRDVNGYGRFARRLTSGAPPIAKEPHALLPHNAKA